MSEIRRQSFLHVSDFERLEEWCRLVRVVFDGCAPYLVGSVHERPDYRDVDLRLILNDAAFDRWWRDPVKVRYVNRAISTWGRHETGLPIDFQVQRQTDANRDFGDAFRNPMGLRDWSRIVTSGIPVRLDEGSATLDPEPLTQAGMAMLESPDDFSIASSASIEAPGMIDHLRAQGFDVLPSEGRGENP